MKDQPQKALDDQLEHLLAMCPPPKGMRVEALLVPLDDRHGDCRLDGRTFKIRINEGADLDLATEILIHEYAHVLTWRHLQALTCDHDEFWGVAYSKVYRAYYGVT